MRSSGRTSILVLSRVDVLDLLSLTDCIEAVEIAFRLHAEKRTLGPGVLSVPAIDGGFHVKAAGLVGERSYFAAKTNGNFPRNPDRFGLPAIQGMVVLADASTGEPLAVIESGSITALRTAAATGVAAKFLARPDSRTATVVGCGVQGEMQLAAIAAVLPLERVWLVDADHARAESLAGRARTSLGLDVRDVVPGTFIAALGADAHGKQELEPALAAGSTLVVDVLEQCAEIGELQHVLAAGLMTREQIHAELGDVVSGRRPGRTRPDEVTIFDSSGTALQDVAAAVAVYGKARAARRGAEVSLDG
jgi:alanine dehydrogenase